MCCTPAPNGWALAGRGIGPFTWFVLGGDLYNTYTSSPSPPPTYSMGALDFYAVPNAIAHSALGGQPSITRLAA
jgi:hypothetical protein